MDDATNTTPEAYANLGMRILQAAHLAVVMHLRQGMADAEAMRDAGRRMVIDAAGPRCVDDEPTKLAA